MTVYREMDVEYLDAQYNARATVGDIKPFLDRYRALTYAAKATLNFHANVRFGETADEVLDIYPAGQDAPVFVFIHGGYWRLLSKDDSAFMAQSFVKHGITTVAVNYALAPEASLAEITWQCRAAIMHLWTKANSYSIDRNRIFVGGSSAGGHLTGMIAADGWQQDFGLPKTVIAGAVPVSGLFELEPLRHCHQNAWLFLDDAVINALSPIRHIPQSGCPMLVVWAEHETSEFIRQSRDFAMAWAATGAPADTLEVAGRNHFDVILDLADPETTLAKRTMMLVQSGGL